ncbi:hypothetical protein HN51_050493 [Arachis hypogaea]
MYSCVWLLEYPKRRNVNLPGRCSFLRRHGGDLAIVVELSFFFGQVELSILHVMARPLVNNNLRLHNSSEMPMGAEFLDSSSSSSNNNTNEGHKYDNNVFRTLEEVMESGPSGGGKGN